MNDYLKHSKGPWKDHKYVGIETSANGKKRYKYAANNTSTKISKSTDDVINKNSKKTLSQILTEMSEKAEFELKKKNLADPNGTRGVRG